MKYMTYSMMAAAKREAKENGVHYNPEALPDHWWPKARPERSLRALAFGALFFIVRLLLPPAVHFALVLIGAAAVVITSPFMLAAAAWRYFLANEEEVFEALYVGLPFAAILLTAILVK